MMLTNKHFIIIGAQRSGSTLLYYLLNQHLNICMAEPLKPEPKYFLRKEINYLEYLKKHFPNKKKEHTLLGEKSTSYYESSETAARIKKILPKSKIIIILRDPIYRAISNYYFSKHNNLEKRSLEEVFLEKNYIPDTLSNISTNPYNYLDRGLYSKHINKYTKLFGIKNIKILILENLLKEELEFTKLLTFLRIDSSNSFQIYKTIKKINTGNYPKVCKKVLKALTEYYKNPNAELKKNYKVDLQHW